MQLFSLKPGRTVWQEVRDQLCHSAYAVCLMAAFILPVPAWGAAILVLIIAVERELEQHSWYWRAIGRQDLFFWTLAAVLFAVIYYLI